MKKYESDNEYSYILGISLTIEAITKVPEQIYEVIVSSKAFHNEQYTKLTKLCNEHNINLIENDKVIEKLSVKENCYGIGFFKKYHHSLETDKHILLYNFNDYGELGTIMRSACSFNFKDIVLINSNIDYFDPRVVRASMGSIFHLNIAEYDSFDDYKKQYNNHTLIPFIGKRCKELKELQLCSPYSLVIPQNYHDLDSLFTDGYYLEHNGFDAISLSSLSSIVFNYCYVQNVNDMNNEDIMAK